MSVSHLLHDLEELEALDDDRVRQNKHFGKNYGSNLINFILDSPNATMALETIRMSSSCFRKFVEIINSRCQLGIVRKRVIDASMALFIGLHWICSGFTYREQEYFLSYPNERLVFVETFSWMQLMKFITKQ